MTELRVATEFSRYLGGRYRDDGPWSGEEFREDFLRPRIERAIKSHGVLHVVFDGVAGMPTSFLEEAFGGFLRTPGIDVVAVRGALKLDADDPDLWPYLKLAEKFMDQQAKRR